MPAVRTTTATAVPAPTAWTVSKAVLKDGDVYITLTSLDERQRLPVVVKAAGGNKFPCHETFDGGIRCPGSYVSKQLLDQHIQVAHRCRPFVCNGCERPFADLHNANRHGKWCPPLVRRTTKEFRCPLCDKHGKRKDNVKRHISKVHSGQRAEPEEVVTENEQPVLAEAVLAEPPLPVPALPDLAVNNEFEDLVNFDFSYLLPGAGQVLPQGDYPALDAPIVDNEPPVPEVPTGTTSESPAYPPVFREDHVQNGGQYAEVGAGASNEYLDDPNLFQMDEEVPNIYQLLGYSSSDQSDDRFLAEALVANIYEESPQPTFSPDDLYQF